MPTVSSDSTETAPLEATEATETPTTATEAPVLYRHPLTGQQLSEPLTTKPVAVVTNNTASAQPILGIASADILFEHVAEGGGSITRLLAIYTDLENAGTLGPIRSARTYLLDLARAFQAPIVHCGGSSYGNKDIQQTGYPSFNQFVYPDYFYRDQNRLDLGCSSEHTLMTEGPDLLQGLQDKGFHMTAAPNANYGMEFGEDIVLDGAAANTIQFRFFSQSGKITTMAYDAGDGVYYGTQQWGSQSSLIADGNIGAVIPFQNVLILSVDVRYAEDGVHVLTTMTGEGTGYFACGGRYLPIKWYRETTADPFTYTYADGTPVVFGVGKTYVAMLPTRSPAVIFE